MMFKFGISFILISFVCLQPQEVFGGTLNIGLVDRVRENVRERIVRPIHQVLHQQRGQSTDSIPPVTTILPSPDDSGVSSQNDTVALGTRPEILNPEPEVEAVTPPGESVTGDDEKVTGTTEGKNIIGAPSVNGICPSGMKNYNGRCRKVIGRR